MGDLKLKASDRTISAYYDTVNRLGQLHFDYELAVRSAFQDLLTACCRKHSWTFVPEFLIERPRKKPLRVDGALVDQFRLTRGMWEAKDKDDHLASEAKKKFDLGYPSKNIIFQSPDRALLFQNGVRVGMSDDITNPDNLVELLQRFFAYREPHHDEWEAAVDRFQSEIPQIAGGIKQLIAKERKASAFADNFARFCQVCRQSINPKISDDAVEEMLIQHLLTERIFRRVFNNPDFVRRNVIAAQIETVIDSLSSRHFSRDAFLQDLDYFYVAIERSAQAATGFVEKQQFLNAIYEKFFKGYCPKEADTHGIVYTPHVIVDFILNSVEEILLHEFKRSPSDNNVHILDPFVGTGTFLVHAMRKMKRIALFDKYDKELHCNEIMLMPYYIASMNIEREYLDLTGEYAPFQGICFVDTFELAESQARTIFNEENTNRVQRQKNSPIFVIIGNPPYNAGQASENDENQNRRYGVVDQRIKNTYIATSAATLNNKLTDPYVRAIRWASDRLNGDGIVAFVTNNSFLDATSFDGMRDHLRQDFSAIYSIDLRGDARTAGEQRRKEGGNIFDDQIRVGVAITFFVKKSDARRRASVWRYTVDDYLSSAAKKRLLEDFGSYSRVPFKEVDVDERQSWTGDAPEEFKSFMPLCKKHNGGNNVDTVAFEQYSLGVSTNRDEIAYCYQKDALAQRVSDLLDRYNNEVARYESLKRRQREIFEYRPDVKWSETLKRSLQSGSRAEFSETSITTATTRPFTSKNLYYAKPVVDRPGHFAQFLPTKTSQGRNRIICCSATSKKRPFYCLCVSTIPDLHLTGDTQCFPLYVYEEDGRKRRANVSDAALEEARTTYLDEKISAEDFFHYIYGILHHTGYREKYACNLAYELPRVPWASNFWELAEAGKLLADMHTGYEQQVEYPLERVESPKEKLNWQTRGMRLTKNRSEIIYNDFLTLRGIPAQAFEYRLGHQSALEWIIEQHKVRHDDDGNVISDPNRSRDPQYIVRLVGKIITISIETVKIVTELSRQTLPSSAKKAVGTSEAAKLTRSRARNRTAAKA